MGKYAIDYKNIDKNLNKLSKEEVDYLCYDIRDTLINTISKNGGHLSSNLGVVELTVAIHKSFNFDKDVIIFDVGHQAYTHKLLTGRNDDFHTIRQYKGLSGFPKIEESKYDFFNTGHSSTSISAALGYARAAKINNINRHSIALIGDGALTAGMAVEALSDAGSSDEKIIVILNDNEMSITKNVGGFSRHLANIRAKKFYYDSSVRTKKIINKIPLIGKYIYKVIHRFKVAIKYLFTQGVFFEELGFKYLGPVDGHDIERMCEMFEDAKKINGPVLIHVITTKGKGYKKAQDAPEYYHGVSKFNVKDGISINKSKTFSSVFGKYITELAEKDDKISVICPATTIGNGLYDFYKSHKTRIYDVGIAEQHAVTLAAGMAIADTKPIIAMYSTFLQRAYDQILHDVCLMKLGVLFCIDRAGIVGTDGDTHQGIYDISFLNSLPYINIYAPSRESDFKEMMYESLYNIEGPCVVRYSKGECIKYDVIEENDKIGPCYLKKGKDVVLLSYNITINQLIIAANLLEKQNITCSIVDIRRLKPLNTNYINEIISNHKITIFVEESVSSGSVYSFFWNKENVYGINLDGKPCDHGEYLDLLRENKMDGESIYKFAMEKTNDKA